MMTSANVHETERERLGKVIRFYREQRKLRPRDVADRVGVSQGDYEDWERGKHAPPRDRWGRLCNMLHDKLFDMRATWQRALAEDEAEKASLKSSAEPLTNKPFANIKEVIAAAPPPKLTIVPPPKPPAAVDAPPTLHDDGFDLRPAYVAVQKLPPGWNTAEQRTARQVAALEMIEAGKLTSEEIVAEVKRRFGVGISPNTLSELRAQVQESKKRMKKPPEPPPLPPPPTPATGTPVVEEMPVATLTARINYVKMVLGKAPSTTPQQLHDYLMRKFNVSLGMETLVTMANEARAARVTGPQPIVRSAEATVEPKALNEADIEAATRLLLDAIPNLKEFRIDVDESGEVHVSHKVREVRVVETTGTFKLRKP